MAGAGLVSRGLTKVRELVASATHFGKPPEADDLDQIRTQLAGNLKSVISQALLPRKGGFGRVAAFEVMITTPAIQNLIRENKSFRITSSIQTGHKYGMNLLDEHLLALYRKGIITYDVASGKAQSPDEFRIAAKQLGMDDAPKDLEEDEGQKKK